MRRIAYALALVLAVGGCANSPTMDQKGPPLNPEFDTGFLGGSGNVTTPDDESTVANSATADSVRNGKTGFLGGSGN